MHCLAHWRYVLAGEEGDDAEEFTAFANAKLDSWLLDATSTAYNITHGIRMP